MTDTLDFATTAQKRHSARAFLPEPLTEPELRAVLEDAQRAPSNSNTQPWAVHVVSGAKRDELSRELLRAAGEGRWSMDFTHDPKYYGEAALLGRARAVGFQYYEAVGIARGDHAARGELQLKNLEFFGAPHVALLFMPLLGDGVRTAADVGMYAQTFLLSLVARGFAGIPQTVLGSFADTARAVLGVPAELKLLFGISFGREDPDHPANSFRVDRTPVEESVILHS